LDSATANTEVPPRNTRGNKAAQKK
jgi:hypothetical protein